MRPSTLLPLRTLDAHRSEGLHRFSGLHCNRIGASVRAVLVPEIVAIRRRGGELAFSTAPARVSAP